MSIRRIQTEQALENIVREVYSAGRQPPLGMITARLAKHLSEYPLGAPLRSGAIPAGTADPEQYNSVLRALALNLSVLYESALEQVEDVLQVTSSLQSDLRRLTAMRRKLETKIDDYLLAMFNTDGYYYSVSDTFSTTDLTDLSLTSAQVDVAAGAVVLPSVTSTTRKVAPEQFSNPSLTLVERSAGLPIRYLSPFSGALQDGLSNMVWAFEVEATTPQEVVVEVVFQIGNGTNPLKVSRLEMTPYGVAPVQAFMYTRRGVGDWTAFSNTIQSSSNKMTFSATSRDVTNIRLTLRKTKPDYTDSSAGEMRYRYIFGAQSISVTEQSYDLGATFVSDPHSLPDDLQGENVIDGVSLVVDEEVPSQTEMNYYVAVNVNDAQSVSDFTWHSIVPVDSEHEGDKIVRFDGAAWMRTHIFSDAQIPNRQLIPRDSTNTDLAKRNPTPSIIPAVNIYRIAAFNEEILLNSVELFEGVRTTRIYSRSLDPAATTQAYWADYIKNNNAFLTEDFGRINPGSEFFSGADVGVAGRSVYVETYLECDQDRPQFLAEFQKVNAQAHLWDVRVFHGGKELGHLPPGVNSMQLPWRLRKGQNHISLIVQIPLSGPVPDVHLGEVNLMAGTDLHSYGETFLEKWRYVSFFDLQYKEKDPKAPAFTIHNGEIITRRKPTNNYMMKYARATGNAPHSVRIRADLARSTSVASASPQLRSYRLRFSYGPED